MGSGGNREKVPREGAMGRKVDMLQRPQTAASPKLALSHPDRRVAAEDGNWKSTSLKQEVTSQARPGSARAPGLRATGLPDFQGDASSPNQNPPRVFGRISLYDQVNEHTEAYAYLGESSE